MKDLNDENLIDEATQALNEFFKNFGNFDIYTQIVLEEFFKELLNE